LLKNEATSCSPLITPSSSPFFVPKKLQRSGSERVREGERKRRALWRVGRICCARQTCRQGWAILVESLSRSLPRECKKLGASFWITITASRVSCSFFHSLIHWFCLHVSTFLWKLAVLFFSCKISGPIQPREGIQFYWSFSVRMDRNGTALSSVLISPLQKLINQLIGLKFEGYIYVS
jgi:hypothetical protein